MEVDLAPAKQLVESAITKLGVDPVTVRAKDTSDQASWTLKRGSASLLVTVINRPGAGRTVAGETPLTLRVVSPVMSIPDAAKRLPLFVKLLELNANGLGNCAFGLVGDRVVALSERPVAGLDAGEVEQIVRQVAAVADTYDDKLVNEFGGVRASDKQQ